MDNLVMDRAVDPRFPEAYMEDIENVKLGAEFMKLLRNEDSPLVVRLVINKYRGIETPPLYHIRTSLEFSRVKTMDVTFYTSSLPEFGHENKEEYWYTNPVTRRILIWGVFIVGLFLGILVG